MVGRVQVIEIEQMVAKEPPVGVRFPRDVKSALEKLAKADDRSLSYIINKIVAEYLRAKKLIK
jgi:predicted transcriptional regulator